MRLFRTYAARVQQLLAHEAQCTPGEWATVQYLAARQPVIVSANEARMLDDLCQRVLPREEATDAPAE